MIVIVFFSIVGIWIVPEVQRQQRFMRTVGVALVASALLAIWFLIFSRIPFRLRLSLPILFLAGIAAFAGLFRIRGVNGDLVPIFEPRWKKQPTFAVVPGSPQKSSTNLPAIRKITGEFPQFFGPNRNAILDRPGLETNWSAHPPKLLWKQPVGAAWSGFVIKDGLAITQEQRGESEFVTCYELLTGKPVWAHSDFARYFTAIAGEGPRATPTIDGDRVYTFGATGILNCLELHTGKKIWAQKTAIQIEAPIPEWGFTSSPLAIDGKVVVSAGGSNARSLAAYSASDGTLAWASGFGGADYSSPLDLTFLGQRQIVIFNGVGVSGFSLDGQKAYWTYPWPGKHPHISMPVAVSSNLLFVSSGYGIGSELLKLDRTNQNWTVTREWKALSLKSKFGPIFLQDDHIYGLDDGILTCIELKTGQRRWKDGRFGHGQGLLVAGTFLLTSEKGEIILVQPNSERLVEIGRFQVFNDKTWNPPALAGEYLLMRNDKEAACIQLATSNSMAKNLALSFAKQFSRR